MAAQRLIEEIIANFTKQYQLYIQIADISGKQLDLLTGENWIDHQEEYNKILQDRQLINQEIDALNRNSRALQAQVTALLELPDFVLSSLEGKLEAAQYDALKNTVNMLGDILSKISGTDEQNHMLIKKKAGPERISSPANRKQAQNAYQQAVRQGKKQ